MTDPSAFSDSTLPPEPVAPPVAVHVALVRVMQDVGVIPKRHEHNAPGARFMFRGIEDVQAALHPALARHGVVVLPAVIERRDLDPRPRSNGNGHMQAVALHIGYTFVGPAGDTLTVTAWGEGADSGDKATGKAASAALKVAMLQTFMVPTEDTPDGDRVDAPAPAEDPEQAAERDRLARAAIEAARNAGTLDELQNIGAYAHRCGVLDRQVQLDGVPPATPREVLDHHRAELERRQAENRADDEPAQQQVDDGSTGS